MAKAQGIIGNFKGKIGNTVGYQLTSSNNKQTQGIRIYQPNVKNPKTSAQAEQRAKLAPINATYRALKMVIDRGNEGLPYGNKSRLAWLKQAFKAEMMPWFKKGTSISQPVLCQVTKGSLARIFTPANNDGYIKLQVTGIVGTEATVGPVATAILANYTSLNAGDQLTAVTIENVGDTLVTHVSSIVLDPASTSALPNNVAVEEGKVTFPGVENEAICGCLIVSREGNNGEHLRSSESLFQMAGYDLDFYQNDAKTAAIESYMASGDTNADWEQEPID